MTTHKERRTAIWINGHQEEVMQGLEENQIVQKTMVYPANVVIDIVVKTEIVDVPDLDWSEAAGAARGFDR